jgi:HprK-related kinase B
MIDCNDCEAFAARLIDGAQLIGRKLDLALGGLHLRVRSNSATLIERLEGYFAHVVEPAGAADIEVVAIERDPPQLSVDFIDWRREPGKTGRKDRYYDIPGGRLISKVRTGMVFLQSATQRIAAGPCLRYDNQVINFINAQYMNWLQQRGWLICHAAGAVNNGRAWGIAAFSGGGKSTLMLRLLEDDTFDYLTNDRLFIKREAGGIRAAGIPKLPRINPGTIVHNPRLHPLIPASERKALLELPQGDLWRLEQKFDVMIDRLYGPDRITPQAALTGFLVLNWRRDSDQDTALAEVDLGDRPDLLGAIMKSPGPFLQFPDGRFLANDASLDEAAYLAILDGVPVYEASGAVDFDALVLRLHDLMR